MSKLTKQLRKDWAQMQGWRRFNNDRTNWKGFLSLASEIYGISAKEVANRIH